MINDVTFIAKLRFRHAATWLSRVFAIAGSDPMRETSGIDRAYQIYAALAIFIALGMLWVMGLSQIEGAFSLMPPLAAEAFLRIVLIAAICTLGVLGIKAVRGGPFVYSPADISYLVSSPACLGFVALSGFFAAVGKSLVVGGFAGFALGVACVSAGLSVEPVACLVAVSLLCGLVSGFPWVVGSLRVWGRGGRFRPNGQAALLFDSALARWCMRAGILLAGAVAIGAVMQAGQNVLLSFASPASFGLDVLLIAVEAALVFSFGRRADASAIAQEAEVSYGTKKDILTTMLVAASFGSATVKDEVRRRKVMRRKPVMGLAGKEGAAAVLSRSALSMARQREGWGLLVAAGGAIAPFGAIALSSTPNPVLLIAWVLVLQRSARAVREMARPFNDDIRLRIVRDRLPFSTFVLFVLDVAPGFVVALSAQLLLFLALALCLPSESVALLSLQWGIGVLPTVLLAPLVLLGMAVCCAFDVVRAPFGARNVIGYELAAFLFSAIPSILAFFNATYGYIFASVALMCLALIMAAARWGD